MRRGWFITLLLMFFSVHARAQGPAEEELQFFEQKIRPVLVKHCYSCHSAEAREAKKLQADLYLDSAAGILAGGESGPAIVKGKSAESLLLKALKFDGFEMPPTGKLSNEIIADFAKWIDSGAADPRQDGKVVKAKREINLEEGRQWWSFQPLRAVNPPPVPTGARIQTPIDQFIQAALAEHKLTVNGPASKDKLIRRAYFDLIGLPPTPEQIATFVADDSPQAFEKVIDELLASPHYGEKWARHWLDVARYAESGGYEFDGFRGGAYHYRDWVIRSLNDDLPYNEFVRQQLAGDKLQPDDYASAAASGFLVAGPYPGQITAKTVERIRYDQLDDMLMTVGGSMLGLTLGCVRCHDHKYDPIPQQDYYALAAALAKTGHGSRTLDPDPSATQRAMEAHSAAHEPLVKSLQRFAAEQLPKHFETWRAAELGKQPEAPRWQIMEAVDWDAERSWLKELPGGILAHDGLLVAGVNVPKRGQGRKVAAAETYSLKFHTHQKNVMSFRLDAFTDKSLPQRGPGVNNDGSFQLAELKVTARPLDSKLKDPPQVLKLKPVFAAFEDKDQPLAQAVDGMPATAWVVKTNAKKDNAAVFELEAPLAGFAGGTELVVELKFRDLGIGRLRFSLSTEANPATWAGDFVPQHVGEIRAILATNGNKLPAAQYEGMTRWLAPFHAETAKAFRTVRDHAAAEPRPKLSEVYTTVPGGQDVFLLRRGEVENKLGKAEPGFIQVLRRETSSPVSTSTTVAGPSIASTVEPRIALADWMTNVEQGAGPLLARVQVNRLWQHHFGQGLVGTPNDFGAQGERPTHPELLEWLASEFVNHDWKLKPLHKLIMLSATYQQANDVSAANLKIDPANRYWWHYQPRRLDAELIRDSLLAIGGNLDKQMYGPSILDGVPRRSIYLRVKRSELIPLMTMFDAPEPTQSIGERISTTVPTQSLAMMNSPFVRQQAEKLAQRIKPNADTSVAAAIDQAYQITFARLPTEPERARLVAFVEQQKAMLGTDAAATDKALVEVCQLLLCLNEFVYVD
ncbi:Planctomycete cytochrome C [Anatilimnocola aggregata]|uniref:Planctomycete cytochrome C n=1 Tax=Anatilimnocola aggregata TaxID=2528021 RepID=A0A517YDJ6_9BACT|nr:PSD1 and planctomycete cytochrome C domain-containing protein [Anatilimnocola aggregata]QDU28308.1 Planctomycete cytochrome C [Anatilimnocola aggregata]